MIYALPVKEINDTNLLEGFCIMYAKIYHSSVCTQYVIYHFDKVSFSHLVHSVSFFFIYFY